MNVMYGSNSIVPTNRANRANHAPGGSASGPVRIAPAPGRPAIDPGASAPAASLQMRTSGFGPAQQQQMSARPGPLHPHLAFSPEPMPSAEVLMGMHAFSDNAPAVRGTQQDRGLLAIQMSRNPRTQHLKLLDNESGGKCLVLAFLQSAYPTEPAHALSARAQELRQALLAIHPDHFQSWDAASGQVLPHANAYLDIHAPGLLDCVVSMVYGPTRPEVNLFYPQERGELVIHTHSLANPVDTDLASICLTDLNGYYMAAVPRFPVPGVPLSPAPAPAPAFSTEPAPWGSAAASAAAAAAAGPDAPALWGALQNRELLVRQMAHQMSLDPRTRHLQLLDNESGSNSLLLAVLQAVQPTEPAHALSAQAQELRQALLAIHPDHFLLRDMDSGEDFYDPNAYLDHLVPGLLESVLGMVFGAHRPEVTLIYRQEQGELLLYTPDLATPADPEMGSIILTDVRGRIMAAVPQYLLEGVALSPGPEPAPALSTEPAPWGGAAAAPEEAFSAWPGSPSGAEPSWPAAQAPSTDTHAAPSAPTGSRATDNAALEEAIRQAVPRTTYMNKNDHYEAILRANARRPESEKWPNARMEKAADIDSSQARAVRVLVAPDSPKTTQARERLDLAPKLGKTVKDKYKFLFYDNKGRPEEEQLPPFNIRKAAGIKPSHATDLEMRWASDSQNVTNTHEFLAQDPE